MKINKYHIPEIYRKTVLPFFTGLILIILFAVMLCMASAGTRVSTEKGGSEGQDPEAGNRSVYDVLPATRAVAGAIAVNTPERAVTFSLISDRPRIFTPNGDGWNEYFKIICANPYDGNVSGKIYDRAGAFVTEMKKGGAISSEDVSLTWDGNYSDGRPAPGGVYIYQVEISGPENKVITGTVVIAR